jgi:hypothetical protein
MSQTSTVASTASVRLAGGTRVTCTATAAGLDLFIGTFTTKGSKGAYSAEFQSALLTTSQLCDGIMYCSGC